MFDVKNLRKNVPLCRNNPYDRVSQLMRGRKCTASNKLVLNSEKTHLLLMSTDRDAQDPILGWKLFCLKIMRSSSVAISAFYLESTSKGRSRINALRKLCSFICYQKDDCKWDGN
jgi:hypothetical protein